MLGGTASAGIEVGVRNGDFARSCGLLGAGVVKPGVVNPGVPYLVPPFCRCKSS